MYLGPYCFKKRPRMCVYMYVCTYVQQQPSQLGLLSKVAAGVWQKKQQRKWAFWFWFLIHCSLFQIAVFFTFSRCCSSQKIKWYDFNGFFFGTKKICFCTFIFLLQKNVIKIVGTDWVLLKSANRFGFSLSPPLLLSLSGLSKNLESLSLSNLSLSTRISCFFLYILPNKGKYIYPMKTKSRGKRNFMFQNQQKNWTRRCSRENTHTPGTGRRDGTTGTRFRLYISGILGWWCLVVVVLGPRFKKILFVFLFRGSFLTHTSAQHSYSHESDLFQVIRLVLSVRSFVRPYGLASLTRAVAAQSV